MRLWLAGAFAAVSLITAGVVYLFGDKPQARARRGRPRRPRRLPDRGRRSPTASSRLARAAGEMAAGSFDAPLETGGLDEIGDLARALESMRASLKESFGVLTADRNKLAAIFDGLTDAVMVVDFDGPVRFSNSAAADLLDSAGLPPEAILPQLRRAAEVGFSAHPALRIGDRAYAMTARSLPDERAVLAVVRDRTDEMRRELAEADFVSNAAHELRNPLAGISERDRGPAGAAPRTTPRRRDHFLDRLAEDAERMNRLTRSLLTLARVESRRRRRERDRRRPGRDPRRGRGRSRRRRTSSCVVEVEPDLAAKGDPTLLRQVMVGLLTNAFKNTPPPGTVTVRGRRDGEDGSDLGGDRHRNRDSRGGDRARLRALLPPRGVAQARGLRPRPGDRPADGRRDGRRDRRQLGRGRGQHLLGPPPDRASRARPRWHEEDRR